MPCCFDSIVLSGFSQIRALKLPTKSRECYIPVLQTMILQLKASQVSDMSVFVSCGIMCVKKGKRQKYTVGVSKMLPYVITP